MFGGVLQFLMTLEPLVHVPRLRCVERNPLPVFGLFRIDVIPWRRREFRVNGIDRVWIHTP